MGGMWKACCVIFWMNCGFSNMSVAKTSYNGICNIIM